MLAYYFLSLALIIVCMTTAFSVAIIKRDNSFVNIAYGPAIVISGTLLAWLASLKAPLAPHVITILLFVYIWGLRLAGHLYAKNRNQLEEVFRFKVQRTLWIAEGRAYFYIRSYLQIFLLRGFVASIVLLPLTLTVKDTGPLITLSFFGIALWIIGFLFESIGDAQLDSFIKRKRYHRETIMKSGLWKYSRHPNYFGEASMWWGIAFIAFSASGNAIVFLSPMLITYLLIYVSGIPVLEEKWRGIAEWEAYKEKTSPFLPLPPK